MKYGHACVELHAWGEKEGNMRGNEWEIEREGRGRKMSLMGIGDNVKRESGYEEFGGCEAMGMMEDRMDER